MPAATVRVSRLVIEAVLYSAPLSAASSSSSDSEDGGMRSLGGRHLALSHSYS